MAKTKVSEWSSTPGSNTDIDGINLAEGMIPSDVNNALREMMSQLKNQQAGLDGDNFTVDGSLILNGATSGATTFLPIDAATATITLPSVTGTLATLAGAEALSNKTTIGVSGYVGTSATDALVLPSGTTAERGASTAGKIRYNSTTSSFEGYGTAWGSIGGGDFVTGTRMSFQQTSAPTGWTKDTTAAINDSILRFVTGTASSGGSTAFSTYNGVTAVGATTLTTAQIPSHLHSKNAFSTGNYVNWSYTNIPHGSDNGGAQGSWETGLEGGGGSHDHTITRNIKYYDFIIASKD